VGYRTPTPGWGWELRSLLPGPTAAPTCTTRPRQEGAEPALDIKSGCCYGASSVLGTRILSEWGQRRWQRSGCWWRSSEC